MSTSDLLSRLKKVKRTGRGCWQACCPAHEDHSPSLSIRELEDGRILIRCFAGCGVDKVDGSFDLRMDDLYPPRESGSHFIKGERRSVALRTHKNHEQAGQMAIIAGVRWNFNKLI